jgi:hypothetical protein
MDVGCRSEFNGAHFISSLLKNGHLRRFPHPSALRSTAKYASLLRISGALHLALFEQPAKDDFSSSLSVIKLATSRHPTYGNGYGSS